MPGSPSHIFILRLALATMLALVVPWMMGPASVKYRTYVLSLTILTLLGGMLRARTKMGGLSGDLATGAMALLMLSPAVGSRNGSVKDAIFTATHISPHDALFQLPAIAQTVPNASGPLLLGAGLAILTIAGRLGAVYAGIALGAAASAWLGHTLALEAGLAMRAERFGDAVLYAQAMRSVGACAVIGAIFGFPFYRQGKKAWRENMHQTIYADRMAEQQARRDAEMARVNAAKAELKSQEDAAKKASDEAEELAAETNSGVQIDDSAGDSGHTEDAKDAIPDAKDATPDAKDATPDAKDIKKETPKSAEDATPGGEGGGFGEEDYEIEDGETDSDDDGSQAPPPQAAWTPIEIEPRFDIESPIVIEVGPEEADPDFGLPDEAKSRMRRISSGTVIIACLAAAWTATPPWFEVLRALPDPYTPIAVPISEPGLSIARQPMDPFHREFDEHLALRKHGLFHGAPWSCLPDTSNFGSAYGTVDRAVETLAVPSDTPVLDLYDAVQKLRRRGVYRMGLTGRADPPYGPLGALFAWPTVQVLLDRPPRALQWMKLHPRSIEELPLLPGKGEPHGCALLLDPDVSIDHLYNTVRSLGSIYGDKRCQGGIALVFPDDGSTTNSNPAWRGCP